MRRENGWLHHDCFRADCFRTWKLFAENYKTFSARALEERNERENREVGKLVEILLQSDKISFSS